MCKAWDDQREVGMQEGMQKGMQETLRNTACRMIRRGDKVKDIAEILDVTEEQVKEWVSETV